MSAFDLRNGIFLAPFHPLDEDPTEAIHRDLALVEHLDRLGFEEAWIGEHHSAGFEIISSPELFIAAAAERTKRIRLGTGVVSLPYHQPLMVANRILQLDHMTRGRVMFGAGFFLVVSFRLAAVMRLAWTRFAAVVPWPALVFAAFRLVRAIYGVLRAPRAIAASDSGQGRSVAFRLVRGRLAR